MENITSAKTAIEAEIFVLENKLVQCKSILSQLESLALSKEIGVALTLTKNVNSNAVNESEKKGINEDFKDYPFSKRLIEKLKYLDDKFPKAWRRKNRLEQMIQIEGEEAGKKLKKFFSQNLNTLINSGVYVGAKYNHNNKTQFYCRVEWLNEDKKSIKDEYVPSVDDMDDIPLSRRGNEFITWSTSKI